MIKQLIQDHFYALQIGVGAFFLFLWFLRRKEDTKSPFKVREADRVAGMATKPGQPANDALAKARYEAGKILLEGFRPNLPPHEILGVKAGASADEVQKAWKDLMKRYHPDQVGRPGTREWQDAQRIAEVINHAKDTLLKTAK